MEDPEVENDPHMKKLLAHIDTLLAVGNDDPEIQKLQEGLIKLSQVELPPYVPPICHNRFVRVIQDPFLKECTYKGALKNKDSWIKHFQDYGAAFLCKDVSGEKPRRLSRPVNCDGYLLTQRDRDVLRDRLLGAVPSLENEPRESDPGTDLQF